MPSYPLDSSSGQLVLAGLAMYPFTSGRRSGGSSSSPPDTGAHSPSKTGGGAEGTRTPDLLVAANTLRHKLIEDERSALARLPELGGKVFRAEGLRATGTDDCVAHA